MKYKGISIIKHKTCNTWYARYRNNGKQFYVSADTQKECYNKLKCALKNVNREKQNINAITFGNWYNKWLELYKKDIKDATKRDYSSSMNYLTSLKDKNISEISSLETMEILNKINFERRRQKVYELLNAVFEKAEQNEIIAKNPLKIIDKPKHKKVSGEAFSNEDENKLIEALKQNNLDIFLVCLYQGLRRGEVLALTRDDVDFENRELIINKALNSKNEIDTTKNAQSNRVMPLFDNTIELLQKYKVRQGRLFDMAYSTREKYFNKIKKELFPNKKYTIHSFRHTFITRCQEANISLHFIQKWVGHTQGSQITSKIYTHARSKAEQENILLYNQNLLKN